VSQLVLMVWLPIQNFKNRKLEIAARGKDVVQISFYRIAFHAQNDSTLDDIHSLPFIYRASDSKQKIHTVQYL
jgi:hypothetical protein